MKSIKSVNDFVIKFANVNGTGSASANSLFAKAIFRMGVPVSPKNIFPSNIFLRTTLLRHDGLELGLVGA